MPTAPKPMARRPLAGAGSAPASPGTPAPAQTPAQQQAAVQGGQAAPQPNKQVGTGFVDLSRILEANRSGAQAMGQKLATGVQQQGQAAQQGIQAGQQAFNTATTEKTLQYDPTKATTAAQAAQLASTVYSGPKSWDDAGVDTKGLTSTATRANDAAQAVATQGGRAALLKEGGGRFTTGGVTLDSALAGATMGNQAEQLRSQYGSLSDMLAAARGGATATYDSAVATTKDAAARYGTLAGELRGQEEAAAIKAQRDAEAARAQEIRDRDAAAQDRTGNLTTVTPGGAVGSDTGAWAGSDNLVSPGGKGPRVDPVTGENLTGRRRSR